MNIDTELENYTFFNFIFLDLLFFFRSKKEK